MILARSQAPVRDPGAAARRAAPRLLGPTCDWHSSMSWAHCGRYRVARRTRVDENHDMGLVAGPRPDVVGAWLAEVSRCDRDSRDQELGVPEPGSCSCPAGAHSASVPGGLDGLNEPDDGLGGRFTLGSVSGALAIPPKVHHMDRSQKRWGCQNTRDRPMGGEAPQTTGPMLLGLLTPRQDHRAEAEARTAGL